MKKLLPHALYVLVHVALFPIKLVLAVVGLLFLCLASVGTVVEEACQKWVDDLNVKATAFAPWLFLEEFRREWEKASHERREKLLDSLEDRGL
jgi:hypothetical protein